MAINTNIQKENLADAYATAATHVSLHTTGFAVTTGSNEISGGSPAYARKPTTGWAADVTDDGVRTVTVTFDVPAGATVIGVGLWTALTGGTYLDGATVTSQAFASQGTYQVTLTYTQS